MAPFCWGSFVFFCLFVCLFSSAVFVSVRTRSMDAFQPHVLCQNAACLPIEPAAGKAPDPRGRHRREGSEIPELVCVILSGLETLRKEPLPVLIWLKPTDRPTNQPQTFIDEVLSPAAQKQTAPSDCSLGCVLCAFISRHGRAPLRRCYSFKRDEPHCADINRDWLFPTLTCRQKNLGQDQLFSAGV